MDFKKCESYVKWFIISKTKRFKFNLKCISFIEYHSLFKNLLTFLKIFLYHLQSKKNVFFTCLNNGSYFKYHILMQNNFRNI